MELTPKVDEREGNVERFGYNVKVVEQNIPLYRTMSMIYLIMTELFNQPILKKKHETRKLLVCKRSVICVDGMLV